MWLIPENAYFLKLIAPVPHAVTELTYYLLLYRSLSDVAIT